MSRESDFSNRLTGRFVATRLWTPDSGLQTPAFETIKLAISVILIGILVQLWSWYESGATPAVKCVGQIRLDVPGAWNLYGAAALRGVAS